MSQCIYKQFQNPSGAEKKCHLFIGCTPVIINSLEKDDTFVLQCHLSLIAICSGMTVKSVSICSNKYF